MILYINQLLIINTWDCLIQYNGDVEQVKSLPHGLAVVVLIVVVG